MLKDILQTRMNLEMAVTDEMLDIACEVQPSDVCLVPEKREELTTEGGLDVAGQLERMRDAVARLSESGVRSSMFIDADRRQIDACLEIAAPVIEIHTGHYADATTKKAETEELHRIVEGVHYAHELGLHVNAGHGLHYHNVKPIAALAPVRELNIGHAMIAYALFSGLQSAVREMRKLMWEARA